MTPNKAKYPTRADLIPEGLPPGSETVAEGKKVGKTASLGKTLFMQEQAVSSEVEYKMRMSAQGKIMYHAVYGLDSWQEHSEGMKRIYDELSKRGAHLDRWTLILARPMGLPQEMREKTPRETGLMLTSPEDWLRLGQIVPIQPHLGDHIIGSPASVENLLCALAAGVTTVGNLAQYLGYDYPGWTDDVSRTIATVKALGIMAQLKDKGIVTSTNLDDGPTSLLSDRANYIGWAMLEKYVVEDLIGAELKHHFGNLVTDPRMRLAILLALDEIHGRETAGAFINGNTVYTTDSEKNASILCSCVLFDIVGQMRRPTGHAIHPVPLTEHDRIPTPEEIVQVVVMANQMETQARKVADLIDLSQIEKSKDQLIAGGQIFRDKVLKGLAEIGINVSDPMELLLAMRKIGTRKMEELFGVGEEDAAIPGGRRPLVPTEFYGETMIIANKMKEDLVSHKLNNNKGKRILLLSTDVHEYAKLVIGLALQEANIEVIDLGHSVEPEQVLKELKKTDVDGVCITTHNGMALSYAQRLKGQMKLGNVDIPVFMGGRLNQLTGETIPRDVTEEIKKLNIITCNSILDVVQNLKNRQQG